MANELEQKALELLAAEYERRGYRHQAAGVRAGEYPAYDEQKDITCKAIVAALQQAQQPGAQAVESSFLGWVRRAAIEKLRTDDEVTGVMVHAEEQTDSVKVYTDPPPLPEGVSEEDVRTACWAFDPSGATFHPNLGRCNTSRMRAALESYRARLAARGEKGVQS